VIEIRVVGLPGPQGSKKFVGLSKRGRGIMIESSAKVKPWREAVKAAAIEALEEGALSLERHCNGAIRGPVHAEMIFTLPRPKSAPKSRVLPDRKPDLSKLVRSTEDALTSACAYEDDARIVVEVTRKVYVGSNDPDALPTPGAVIRLREAA
jgi:Holliday junction resolvase RusA-like endonuclease